MSGMGSRAGEGGAPTLLLIPLVLIAAGLAGWVASLNEPIWIAAFIAGLAAIAIASSPRVLLVIVIVGGLVIAGLTRMYVPALTEIRWAFALGAWWLAGYGLLQHLGGTPGGRSGQDADLPPLVLWLFGFWLVALCSTALNWPGAMGAVTGIKGYVQMGGLVLALGLLPWPPALIKKLPLLVLAIAWAQLPVALHQYLVLVPARASLGDGVVAADIVAGTFGGQSEAGGANAVLALFLMVVIGGLLSAWQEGVIKGRTLLLLGFPLLGPMLVNEAKVSLVYAVLLFLVLFGSDFVQRPLRFLASGALLVGILALLATAFAAFAPQDVGGIQGLIDFIYEGNFASDYANDGGLTRGAAITYWISHQSFHDPAGLVLGHGAGMTRDLPAGTSPEIATLMDPELGIGRLAITAVLWETGLLGLACVFASFWAAYRGASSLARRFAGDPLQRAVFRALKAATALFFLSLWHKNFFVYQVGYQTFLFLILGYLVYWERASPDAGEDRASAGGR